MAKGEMTFGKGALAVTASLGVVTLVFFPEVLFGPSGNVGATSEAAGVSAPYNGSLSKFVAAVDAKYPGQAAPDDAAIITYSVCQAFDADPSTTYQSFTAQETSAGADAQQGAFVTRTAVQTICPRHKSHLP